MDWGAEVLVELRDEIDDRAPPEKCESETGVDALELADTL